jgi:hypothetical protein
LEHDIKEQVIERIFENDGKIITKNDRLIVAEFSYGQMEKAVRVFFELTKQMNQNAVLRGGYQLSVYYP